MDTYNMVLEPTAISDRAGNPSNSSKHFCEVMGPRWFVFDLDYAKRP